MSLLPIERQAEREGIAQDLAKKRLSLNTSYSHQVIPLMTSADYLRKGLLADSTQTPEDKRNAEIFDRVLAGENIDWVGMINATGYMGKLVKKFAPPPAQ
jgi:hypothetical protein